MENEDRDRRRGTEWNVGRAMKADCKWRGEWRRGRRKKKRKFEERSEEVTVTTPSGLDFLHSKLICDESLGFYRYWERKGGRVGVCLVCEWGWWDKTIHVSGRSHSSLKFKLLNTLFLSPLCVVRSFCSGVRWQHGSIKVLLNVSHN